MLYNLRKSLNSNLSLSIRKCDESDIDLMIKLKRQDKFQPGVYDFQAFKMINNFQFWTGTLKNQPIAFFGSAQYDQNLAHLASFFVKKQHRGKGHGMKLWNHVLSQITAKNIGLNAVLKQQQNYSKFGFKTQCLMNRYTLTERIKKSTNLINLIDCNKVDFQLLNNYDKQNFPSQRMNFLRSWINLPESKAVAYVKNNIVQGYGVLRPTYDGYKLGPLYANNNQVASQILGNLISQIPQKVKVIIDSPSTNENIKQIVDQFKMSYTLSFVNMFLNGYPQIYKKKSIYAITSAEFG